MTRFANIIRFIAALAFFIPAASSAEPTQVRFVYLTAVDLLPYFVADKKGYFTEANLKVEPMVVTGGAAVIGAVSGGSAEVGYAGSVPLIAARIQGLPLKYFTGIALDKGPSNHTLMYVASRKSGIKTAADLKGKMIAMNARSGQCELIARLRLGDAGLSIDDVKVTTIPFPQMQAAIQLGNVDVACNNDPFLSSMKQAGVDVPVMAGLTEKAHVNELQLHSGLFANEEWLNKNKAAALALRGALDKANKYIAANDADARKILMEYTKIDEATAKDVVFSIAQADFPASSLQAVIDAAAKTGVVPKRIEASELIYDFK
jgi:NitT/TauT family transport system substrate-binding protein